MGKIIITLIFIIFFSSIISAEIIIQQQPKTLYNLGDIIDIPIKIAVSEYTKSSFSITLLCGESETEVYKADIKLASGEEQSIKPIIILDKDRIGKSSGICRIKSSLKSDYVLTREFRISDLIILELKEQQKQFAPEEKILIKGEAKKENGELANGFVELKMSFKDEAGIEMSDTVVNGYFSLNISLPKEIKAGEHLLKIKIYEKNPDGEISNNGKLDYNILITQVPTSLELVFEKLEVEPGTNLKVKAVLHDQTGEKIASTSIITIKNNKNNIIKQTEQETDIFLEHLIARNELPLEWTVVVVSNRLSTEGNFRIMEKEDAKIDLINRTLIITNTGNIPYNKNLLIKIDNSTFNINVNLDVDETQKYILSAPDGEYEIEVIENGSSKMVDMAVLTGSAIDIKKAPGAIITLVRHPFVWFFIMAILGFVAFMVAKKGYKKSFIGYIYPKKREKHIHITKKSALKVNNKAELSLSIKGEKQSVSLICLKIKNLGEIEKSAGNSREILQNIVNITEENKAFTYENQDNLIFMFIPVNTKTFKNERTAVDVAQKIQKILKEANKMFRQKIDFGISLNCGEMIVKSEKDSLNFMSIGTLIPVAKKIASIANEEVYLSEKIKEKLMSDVKTEKHRKEGVDVHAITEIKKDDEEHKKFIRDFLNRMEKK